jgi:hypothetical protein
MYVKPCPEYQHASEFAKRHSVYYNSGLSLHSTANWPKPLGLCTDSRPTWTMQWLRRKPCHIQSNGVSTEAVCYIEPIIHEWNTETRSRERTLYVSHTETLTNWCVFRWMTTIDPFCGDEEKIKYIFRYRPSLTKTFWAKGSLHFVSNRPQCLLDQVIFDCGSHLEGIHERAQHADTGIAEGKLPSGNIECYY